MRVLPEGFEGWHQVPVFMPGANHFSWALNHVWSWCDKNCQDKFDALFENHNGYKTWIFKSAEDASFFSLVWKK